MQEYVYSGKDAKLYKNVRHSEKICSVCGGQLISINFPPRDILCSRMGGELYLVVGVRTLPLLSTHKNSTHSYGLVICIVLVHDEFASSCMIGKAHGCEGGCSQNQNVRMDLAIALS
jgi:hypothetical protein